MTKAKRSITPVRGPAAVLGTRVLNRATLARQLLLRRSPPPSGGWAVPQSPPRGRTPSCRYLAAFGPASVKDMQIWAGLTRLREAFDRLGPRLVTFRDEHGVELFDLPDAPRPDSDTPAPPRFLPEFDNLLLSHADRTRVVPDELRGSTWRGNIPYRALLVDGFLAGAWRLDEHALVVEPFGPLTRARRDEITVEGERMLRVMHPDTPYDIRFGTVCR